MSILLFILLQYCNVLCINCIYEIFGILQEEKWLYPYCIILCEYNFYSILRFPKQENWTIPGPLIAPKNFRLYEMDTSVKVEWDSFLCHESDGYIRRFILHFCLAETRGNCSGNPSLSCVFCASFIGSRQNVYWYMNYLLFFIFL